MTDQTVTIKVPSATPAIATPIPGWKTTEFWVTVAALIAGILSYLPPAYAAIVVSVYVAARAGLKAAHALGYVKDLPDLPGLPALAPGQTSTTVTTVQGTAP